MLQEQEKKRRDHFEHQLQEFKLATPLTRHERISRLLGQVDVLGLTQTGLQYLYERMPEMEANGIFFGSAWQYPDRLNAAFVSGTIKQGHPNSSIELLSELRMAAIANGTIASDRITAKGAQAFLREVITRNLEFAFGIYGEETRATMNDHELIKANQLFGFLMTSIPLQSIKPKLLEEIQILLFQRPVVTRPAKEMLRLVKNQMKLSPKDEIDRGLQQYVDALYHPSEGSKAHLDLAEYRTYLSQATLRSIKKECQQMGLSMQSHGLVSRAHVVLVRYLLANDLHDLVPQALDLSLAGKGNWEQQRGFVEKVILHAIHPSSPDPLYGLAQMLERGLFGRSPIIAGLDNLHKLKLDPEVETRILKSIAKPDPALTALQYLMGAIIQVLGQPLGIGQGNNPTCQSARGISMWSQHSPAKLVNMVITAATQNNLIIRFEGKELESFLLGKGLMGQLDYNLDAVSIVLVPHLDKIYHEMMRLATGRFEDPHKWVNPSIYGEWIQMGFASAYDYLTHSILDYNGFMKRFFAAFHPIYSEGYRIVYPNPLGIFITDSQGKMLGFHAISLLRVEQMSDGEIRAYFLNPNNEGRQNWGQGIEPTVYGHGEIPGESSLPFWQLAARTYAFHYNPLHVAPLVHKVPHLAIAEVRKAAEESWGRQYAWIDQEKLW